MAQLSFTIGCGPAVPVPIACPPGYHTEIDKDGSGQAITYTASRDFSPCAASDFDNQDATALGWNPGKSVAYPGNAMRPPYDGFGWYPEPAHCWWTGAADFRKRTAYSFAGTVFQVLSTPDEMAAITGWSVTCTYDVTTTQRFSQRKLQYFRPDFGASFDLTAPATDVCTDITGLTTTITHVLARKTSNPATDPNEISIGANTLGPNCRVFTDSSHSPKLGGGYLNFGMLFTEYIDSQYYEPISGGRRWGSFTHGYGPFGRGIGGGSLEWNAVYKYGQETVTISNVRFHIDASWQQYHCTPDDDGGGGDGPCNCNTDCSPCTGTGSVPSGKCATLCANSGVSDTYVGGWTFKDSHGVDVSQVGWTFQRVTTCSIRVCSPCVTPARFKAGDYAGPYTITWGDSATCICNGHAVYKTYTATFSVVADVICDETVPVPGQTVSYDVSDARRHVRAYTTLKKDGITSDKVMVGLAENVVPLVWTDFPVEIVAKRFCIRWDRQSGSSALYALAELTGDRAGQIWLYKSLDEGHTWAELFKVEDGTRPVLLIARDGRRYCFWFKKGAASTNGVICQRIYDAAGTLALDTKIIYNVAEDDDFNFDEWVGRGGLWRLIGWYTLQGAHKHPTGFCARDGRRFFYFTSGGQLSCYIVDGTDASVRGTFVIQHTGTVDDAQIAVDETTAQDLTWYVSVLYRSNGMIVCKSSKDGVIFG